MEDALDSLRQLRQMKSPPLNIVVEDAGIVFHFASGPFHTNFKIGETGVPCKCFCQYASEVYGGKLKDWYAYWSADIFRDFRGQLDTTLTPDTPVYAQIGHKADTR